MPIKASEPFDSSDSNRQETAAQTLADSHIALQWQVAARVDEVLAALHEGRWPRPELDRLVDYLVYELLDQASLEDWLLLADEPTVDVSDRSERLDGDHVRLRAAVSAVARCAAASRPAPEKLSVAMQVLLRQLEEHVLAEDAAWQAGDPGGGDALAHALRTRPRGWFPLTEGDVIDLDALPAAEALSAALDRLVRMRQGDKVELHHSLSLQPLWRELQRRAAGSYGWRYLQEGPEHWRAQISRRPT